MRTNDLLTKFFHRVVADDQRSLALGVQSAIWRFLGTVPGPLIFGALFDVACLQWQDPCEGDRGNCWIYDNMKLSIYAMSFGIPSLVLTAVFFFLAWLTYPKDRERESNKVDDEQKKASLAQSSVELIPQNNHNASEGSD